ncbi:MAG: hypothetical protein KDA42_11085 [Planctomycetales bacterium]|nr:hypothetical protein [Planctomycetales bacterium]
MGLVGHFTAADAVVYPRGARVIARTRRGLEVGEVLAPPGEGGAAPSIDGAIMRRMSVEDLLLEERLQRNRAEAMESCEVLLAERAVAATLLDVECLFDGRSMLFYFLGEVPPEAKALTAELASVYDASVQMQSFADTLLHGCGPDCGTDKAAGGCDSCTSCAVAAACGK